MKYSRHVIATALAASAATGIAAAEGAATTKTLCAITSTLTCDVAGCVRGPANAVNLPVFVSIDTENNVVETAREGGDRRTSKISSTRTRGRHPGAAGRRTRTRLECDRRPGEREFHRYRCG